MLTKIFVDGFYVDEIETPIKDQTLENAAMTSKVLATIGLKKVEEIIITPNTNIPQIILIFTEIE